MLSITKIFTFEAAHRISDYDGSCSQIHGHSYVLHVTVGGIDLKKDMLLDFKVLKKIVQDEVIQLFDHALLLKETEKNRIVFEKLEQKIFWMDEEPTAERMLLWIKDRIIPGLPSHVELESLTLYETATCYATWKS
ncbi:6-pyruvoyltetrahydropterin/6-carboxytetrahydropterin synthase [Aquiflexum balticum DSM 16537]|uniref:6-carboxy-5,6,7,8-tetrahydropterin synthase n=1 Tax=Aquiflexum balticum DSM 16537 TaxID=758820 RepID=A0A1W2HB94_9BACT|nr:6-carboxytetrahydropterin synthase [Aquiflexum balticum]SMD45998.1 6-pyruvoyltetrahydropterin/6-carboxytetrahydropterin synthase [Aquiflexum balticum DSM 16537]